jgi:hypothetical protein
MLEVLDHLQEASRVRPDYEEAGMERRQTPKRKRTARRTAWRNQGTRRAMRRRQSQQGEQNLRQEVN